MSLKTRTQEVQEMADDYKRAEFAINARRYDLAIEIMQSVLSRSPENSVAFHTIARAYVFKKMYPQAVEAIKESLRLDPSTPVVHTLYGALLKDMGPDCWTQAEEELLAALQLNPSYHQAHCTYAWFQMEQRKNIPKAKEHCKKAMELDANNMKYHWLLAVILTNEGLVEQAEAEYRYVLSREPESARVHNSYGALLLNQRRNTVDALEHFRIALSIDPENEMIRKNFLLALKVNHKLYWLFWHYNLLLRKLGKKRKAIVTLSLLFLLLLSCSLFVLGINTSWRPFSPLLTFVACCMWCLLFLFWLYLRLTTPIFNFLARRGWLK